LIHNKNYSALFFFLVSILPLTDAFAQKRKKDTDNTLSATSRAREAEFYFTEAEKYFILEDYAKALLFYQKTLELVPDNATVHFKMAEVFSRGTREEDLQKAASSIDRALKLEKKNKYFYLLAANIYNSMGSFEKAAEVYEILLDEVQGTEEYLFELAAFYQYANKPEEAIKTYNRVETAVGVNEVSSIQKVKLYLELAKPKEARVEGDKLIATDPTEVRYAMTIAEFFSQQGDKATAIQYLKNSITANDQIDSQVKIMLAGLLRETNQSAASNALLTEIFDDPTAEFGSKALIIATLNAELTQAKNQQKKEMEKETLAISLFEKLSSSYQDEPQLHVLGGDLYLTLGNQQKAKEYYTRAVTLGEVNIEVWQNLLYLHAQQEQFESIITLADQALEYFPNQGMLHYFRGYAKFRKRQYAEAVLSLEQSKILSETNIAFVHDLNAMLGDAYNYLKDYPKSDKAYDDALAYNPTNEGVLNNYSYYLSLRKADLEKAEKMAELLIKNNPDNATYLDTYAWVLYTREKYKEAKRIIERAIGTGKANATHIEHYGDILYKLGNVDDAVTQWQKARGLNANNETLNKKIANRKIYE
jgi:tetratricopeptide (TPR) repeat protein